MSPETRGDKLQDTTHSTCRCRTDIPLIPRRRIPAQEPRRATSRGWWGGGGLGTELHLGPSPCFFFPRTHFETQANDTLKAGQSLHQQPRHPPTVYTQRRLIPEKTQHPPKQKVETDIAVQPTDCILILTSRHLQKPWPFLYCFGRRNKNPFKQHTLRHSLAPAPTDLIDDSHARIKL